MNLGEYDYNALSATNIEKLRGNTAHAHALRLVIHWFCFLALLSTTVGFIELALFTDNQYC